MALAEKKRKVLIVDDDETHNLMKERILVERGNFDVVSVSESEYAMEMIKKERPDIVILDVMMPKVDGFTILKEIRDSEELKQIGVLICSAKTFDVDKKKAFQLGADAFVSKFVKANELIDEVNKVLEDRNAT